MAHIENRLDMKNYGTKIVDILNAS